MRNVMGNLKAGNLSNLAGLLLLCSCAAVGFNLEGITASGSVDTGPLPTFEAGTHSSVDGAVSISVHFLETSKYESVDLRRKLGSVAPAASCDTDTIVQTIPPPFADQVVSDSIGTGLTASYRLCANIEGSPTSIGVAENISASDLTAPGALDAFSCITGPSHGRIRCTIDFPADSSDYALLELRSLAGSSAPSASCNDGTVAASSTGPFAATRNITVLASSANPPGNFSFRICIWDAANNLTSSNSVANIAALDATAPERLDSISATTNISAEVRLTLDFPADTTDYVTIDIYEQYQVPIPATAIDCDGGGDGTVLVDSLSGAGLTAAIAGGTYEIREGASGAGDYAYLVCIRDAAGNLDEEAVGGTALP